MFRITKLLLLAGMVGLIFGQSMAQTPWREITSVEDLCVSYPEIMDAMFEHFNLDHPGLERVKSALTGGNTVDACKYLLAYYKEGFQAIHLRMDQPAATNHIEARADTILKDVFVIQNVRGKVPFGDDGHRDWYYKGPNNDREWAWLSNRHSQINYVFSTYLKTGNPKYIAYIDLFLRDFIIKSLPYPGVKSSTSVWRGLEVSFRAKVWTRIFYGSINSEYISPATQLLILNSLPDHAHYNRNFHGSNNWLTMEISALATLATHFPEYEESGEWLAYSKDIMTESMRNQVYADGVQTELTSHYHNVSLHNFELFKNLCDRIEVTLPDHFGQTIEAMYDYISRAMRPDGNRILNNDGDRGSDRDLILRGSKKYNTKEWEYIATNGKSGTKPIQGPSYFYPWAGQLISRSGYDSLAHWSFFDLGPWGSGHQHNDKNHISVAAYGRDLLVDAGRFAYTGDVARKFRPYARSSKGHNVILIDQKAQDAGPTHASEPLDESHFKITNDFDYAYGSFDRFKDVSGDVEHIRSVMYVRGEFWVVVDRILTGRPRQVDALWHWHPDCRVEVNDLVVKTNHLKGNLAVIPLSKQRFNIKLIKGQEEPDLQGWYSPEYNLFEPNVASCYSTFIKGDETLVWLLLPSEEETPDVVTEIISESDQGIQVEIRSADKNWKLTIPYTGSKNAMVKRL